MVKTTKKSVSAEVSNKRKPVMQATNANKRIAELEASLDAKDKQLRRALADFDNYRKRVAKESGEIGKAGKRELLLGLIGVLDTFERAFQSEMLRNDNPLFTGLRAIFRQIERLLEHHQVISFEVTGQQFDPAFHEAVGTEPSHKYPEGVVAKEMQKGYLWEEKVLRPAQVLVVKNPEEARLNETA